MLNRFSDAWQWLRLHLRYIFWSAAILMAVLGAGAAVLAYRAWDVQPRLVSFSIQPDQDVHVGERVVCRIVVECPWRRTPLRDVTLDLPEGLQDLPGRRLRLRRVGAGVWQWVIEIPLQPYKTGELRGGSVHVVFSGADRGDEAPPRVDVLLPVLKVTPRLSGDEMMLRIAPRLPPEAVPARRTWWQWLLLGGVCAAVLAVAVWLLRRRGEPEPEIRRPPWETAGTALEELEAALPLPAEEFFVRFTDILRKYLEERFHLPAGEQTTQEFLDTLRTSRVLDAECKRILEEVLTAADMVKFARADATVQQMQDALAQARRLLAATRPAPEHGPSE